MLALMAQLGEPPLEQCTPTQAREIRAKRQRPSTEPIHETREVDAGGVPARLYRPNDRDGLGLLVYLHGGGWVMGNLDTVDNVCRILANSSGHAVLSVAYRLAPEHPFPAGLDDALTATRWAYDNAATLGCAADRLGYRGRLCRGQPVDRRRPPPSRATAVPIAGVPGYRPDVQLPEPRRERRRAGADGTGARVVRPSLRRRQHRQAHRSPLVAPLRR